MGDSVLLRSDGNSPIQAMPLKKGKVKITTGTILGVNLVYCVVDGGFTINWNAGGTDTITCYEGNSFCIEDATSITITSGTFHLA